MAPINSLNPVSLKRDVALQFKCHACGQECDVESSPGQAINHRALLGSRLFSVAEQLSAIKLAKGSPLNKNQVPQFLRLTKEKEGLESEIMIWDPISQTAHAILVARGVARCNLPDSKDPG